MVTTGAVQATGAAGAQLGVAAMAEPPRHKLAPTTNRAMKRRMTSLLQPSNFFETRIVVASTVGCFSASLCIIQHQPILAGIDKKTALAITKVIAGRFMTAKIFRSDFAQTVLAWRPANG